MKPVIGLPGDRIDDEDERCRVNNRAFNESRKRLRERRQKMVFGTLYAVGILLFMSFFWLMSQPR